MSLDLMSDDSLARLKNNSLFILLFHGIVFLSLFAFS